MSEALIHALLFEPACAPRSLSSDEVRVWQHTQGLQWVHLDATHEQTKKRLKSMASFPKIVMTALCACAWLACASVMAQGTSDAADGVVEPAGEAILIEDVPEQAILTTALLETVVPGDDFEVAFEARAQTAERLLGDLEVRLDGIAQALDGAPKVRSMQEWEQELRRTQAPLLAIDTELDRQLERIRSALQQVEARESQWRATAELAAGLDASVTVGDRIDTTLKALAAARQALSSQRARVFTLRDTLVDPMAQVDRTIKLLRTKIQSRLTGIFNRDQVVIWNADLLATAREELREGGSETMADRWDRVTDYVRGNLPAVALHILLFVALAAALRAMAARARALSAENYDLRQDAQVFAMPLSMALVIALALTNQIHPQAPFLFRFMTWSILAIPAVLIVSRLLSSANRPVLWALLAAFVVDRVRDFLGTVPTLERATFLAELVAVVGFLLWLRRPSRLAQVPEETKREPLYRMVRRVVGVAMALLVFAIVAELFGLGDLADLVGSGTLRSAYSALFIYALLKVLQSLVAYALILRPLSLLNMVSNHRAQIRRRIERLLDLLAFLLWAYLTLEFFGLDGIVTDWLKGLVGAELVVGALSISLGDVLVLVVTIWLSFALARFLNFVLDEDVFSRVTLPRGMPYAISTLSRYTLIVLGFMVALAAAGIELGKLTIIAGGLGVGIGFGLQTIVSNFVSGLILLFERPLKVGDDISVKTVSGEIRSIGIRASSIRTDDGAEVILPNSQLIAEAVTNWTFRGRRRRIEIPVTVKGGIAADDVIAVLVSAARSQTSVLSSPSPKAYLAKYGEGSLDFVLHAWIAEFRDQTATRSDLAAAVQRALADAGIVDPLRKLTPGPEAPDTRPG